jgi:hypothetical protein
VNPEAGEEREVVRLVEAVDPGLACAVVFCADDVTATTTFEDVLSKVGPPESPKQVPPWPCCPRGPT